MSKKKINKDIYHKGTNEIVGWFLYSVVLWLAISTFAGAAID